MSDLNLRELNVYYLREFVFCVLNAMGVMGELLVVWNQNAVTLDCY